MNILIINSLIVFQYISYELWTVTYNDTTLLFTTDFRYIIKLLGLSKQKHCVNSLHPLTAKWNGFTER